MEKRQRLILKTEALISKRVLPAVPMDEFFEGNTYDRSMGRGMQTSRDLPISEYHEVFRSIRDRDDVQEIFVEINELPDDKFPEDWKKWPQAHVVYIVTSAPVAEIERWVEPLEPRYFDEGWCVRPEISTPVADSELLPGMRPVRIELL